MAHLYLTRCHLYWHKANTTRALESKRSNLHRPCLPQYSFCFPYNAMAISCQYTTVVQTCQSFMTLMFIVSEKMLTKFVTDRWTEGRSVSWSDGQTTEDYNIQHSRHTWTKNGYTRLKCLYILAHAQITLPHSRQCSKMEVPGGIHRWPVVNLAVVAISLETKPKCSSFACKNS